MGTSFGVSTPEFLPFSASWVYTLSDWALTQDPSSGEGMALMVFHLGTLLGGSLSWSFMNFDKQRVDPTTTPSPKRRDDIRYNQRTFLCSRLLVYSYRRVHYYMISVSTILQMTTLLGTLNHTWDLQQTSFLALEVEVMTIRRSYLCTVLSL